MKKITFLFAVLLALTSVKAQDVGVVAILIPTTDTTIAVGGDMPLAVGIKNFGTTALQVGDTIYLNLLLDGQVVFGATVDVTAAFAPFAQDDVVGIDFGDLPLSQVGLPAGTYELCVATDGTNISGVAVADPTASNNQSCVSVTVGTVSVEEKTLDQFSAYPNPANNMINVVSPVSFETVRLFDMAGREVYSFNGTSTTHSINVASLQVGMYFLTIESNNAKTTKKISIAR